jgi:hypothetical protein
VYDFACIFWAMEGQLMLLSSPFLMMARADSGPLVGEVYDGLHLLGDERPASAFEFAVVNDIDDSEKQILVCFVVPLRGHCCEDNRDIDDSRNIGDNSSFG